MIAVQCMNPDCLSDFSVPPDKAGRQVVCPGCGQPVEVPALVDARRTWPIPSLELDDVASEQVVALSQVCPSCNQEMPRGSVLCVACGFDRRLGKRRSAARVERKSKAVIPLRGAREVAVIAFFFGALLLLLFFAILAGRHPIIALLLGAFGEMVLVLISVAAFLASVQVKVSQEAQEKAVCSLVYEVASLPIYRRRIVLTPHHRLLWCHDTPIEAIAIILALVCVGIIPGILCWLVLLNKRSFLKVEDRISGTMHRFSILWGQQSLRELIDTIQEVIDLQVDRV